MRQEHAPEEAAGAGVDELFDALAHPLRRRILASLRGRPVVGVDRLASGDLAPDETEKRTAVALYHNHLPHLDDAGYVRWDRDTGTVTRGPQFDEFRSFATLMDDNEDDLPFDWLTG